MSSIRAVIFDLDGTLIDSEPVYQASDQAFLIGKGVQVGDTDWSDVVGMGAGALVDKLMLEHGLNGDRAELLAEKESYYLNHAHDRVTAFPRTLELVRYLWVNGYHLAIGTGSGRKVLDAMLEQTGLGAYFETTVSSDDVRAGKPDPATFLVAADRLGLAASECLVVEDSQYGVLAAQRAGMACLALPAEGNESKEAFETASLLVAGGPPRLSIDTVVQSFGLTENLTSEGERVARFQAVVYERFKSASRSMPWRETNDPYLILASEFMLQQTQVSRVIPKYEEFVAKFPTPHHLAGASLAELLSFWQGLGYNRRAKHLQEAARTIVRQYGGQVPDSADALLSLPGVGPYTAAAVAAFAFGRPVRVIETNIRRLFLHYFFAGERQVSENRVAETVDRALDTHDPRTWYYALMDYGSSLGKLFPNANRRSAGYSRQSRFEGSVRQVRGQIVKVLTTAPSMSREELERAVGPIDHRFEKALDGLIQDGIIVVRADRFTLE